MDLKTKLSLLADAAKYDASCASSGAAPRKATGDGIGSTSGMGICHSYAPDGRCISLLKLLLTNFCTYDCLYCINRASSNVPRARFSVDEVVWLTLEFYRRNYIEGLFLSSGIIQSPDYTMEQVVEVARRLREDHGFAGYIHLKTIPDASDALLAAAGRYADRLSINVELPSQASLEALAPQKNARAIRISMAQLRTRIDEQKAQPRAPKFAPGGQSTQLIVGADASSDAQILNLSSTLYGSYRLKRVYYSAYSPIPDASQSLPPIAAPLAREHRLYQADWLLRYYGYQAEELATGAGGMLDLNVDPKTAWALAHPEAFPVDVNSAERETLLRVPGLGIKTVDRLLLARRHRRLRLADIRALAKSTTRCAPFVLALDHRPSSTDVRRLVAAPSVRRAPAVQGDLFAPVPERLAA